MSHRRKEIRGILGSLGPLDALTICGFDLHVFLCDFLSNLVLDESEGPIVFPQINQLTILHPVMEEEGDRFRCMNAVMELAKSQHAQGIPFERVTVRMWSLPPGMVEGLGRWIGVVDCCEELYPGE